MQYLLYYVVCFIIGNTTKDVFAIVVVDITLANHRVFMWQHTHDAEVSSTQYIRADGIPSPSRNDIDSP
jgi:uncharacterized protein (UPF0303 family)